MLKLPAEPRGTADSGGSLGSYITHSSCIIYMKILIWAALKCCTFSVEWLIDLSSTLDGAVFRTTCWIHCRVNRLVVNRLCLGKWQLHVAGTGGAVVGGLLLPGEDAVCELESRCVCVCVCVHVCTLLNNVSAWMCFTRSAYVWKCVHESGGVWES